MSIVLPAVDNSAALVDATRATYNATLSAVNTANPSLLTALLAAASTKIKQYCYRDFWQTTYTEYYDGGNHPYDVLKLRQYPVANVTRLAVNPKAALAVSNTSAANQRATVATTQTGITLNRVASGVSTQNVLSYADYVTVQAMATAIGNLGNGWTATAQNGLALNASVDITPTQGAVSCVNVAAYLEMHTEEPAFMGTGTLSGWDEEWGGMPGWRLDPDSGIAWGRFPRGRRNVRVDYVAGYATIPDDVQEACVQLACDLYYAGNRDSSVKSESLGPYSYTLADRVGVSAKVATLLAPYRVISNTIRR